MREPRPGGGVYTTSYSYNGLDRLTQVVMVRDGVTQVRTFVYDAATQRLASATHPETGTVTYAYNADGTLQSKTDAKGQRIEYSYDSQQRVTRVRRFNEGADGVVVILGDRARFDRTAECFGWDRLVSSLRPSPRSTQFCTHWVSPASRLAAFSTRLAACTQKSAADGSRASRLRLCLFLLLSRGRRAWGAIWRVLS